MRRQRQRPYGTPSSFFHSYIDYHLLKPQMRVADAILYTEGFKQKGTRAAGYSTIIEGKTYTALPSMIMVWPIDPFILIKLPSEVIFEYMLEVDEYTRMLQEVIKVTEYIETLETHHPIEINRFLSTNMLSIFTPNQVNKLRGIGDGRVIQPDNVMRELLDSIFLQIALSE